MSRFATIAALTSLALVASCKKDDKPAAGADPSGKPAEVPAGKPAAQGKASGPFAAWDLDARRAAMQGAHVTPGGGAGHWAAWNVVGDKVTIWDGKAEQTLELSITSPCEATTTLRSADGSSSGTVSHFTLKDGAVVMGLGDAGSRRGAEAVACISNTIFTLDAAGVCLEWEESMFDKGEYKSKPATCGWKQEGDVESFVATVHQRETALEVHGDALLSTQLARTHSEKVADFAAARAARDSK